MVNVQFHLAEVLWIVVTFNLLYWPVFIILMRFINKPHYDEVLKPNLRRLFRKTRVILYKQCIIGYRSLVLAYFMACRMVGLMTSPKIVFPVLNYLTCYFVFGFCLTGLVTALNHIAILYRHWFLKIG